MSVFKMAADFIETKWRLKQCVFFLIEKLLEIEISFVMGRGRNHIKIKLDFKMAAVETQKQNGG